MKIHKISIIPFQYLACRSVVLYEMNWLRSFFSLFVEQQHVLKREVDRDLAACSASSLPRYCTTMNEPFHDNASPLASWCTQVRVVVISKRTVNDTTS